MSYLHPGVYVEEIPSGSRPIEGVSTSVTAFVGYVYRGPVAEPTLIGNFDEYVKAFGPIVDENDAMGLAVQAFYLNGGGAAYICRLADSVATAQNFNDINDEGTNATPVLSIKASSPGTWGNMLQFKIEKESATARSFSLLVGTSGADGFEEKERFDGLSMNESSSDYVETIVNQASALVCVKVPSGLTYQQARVTGSNTTTIGDVQTYLGGSNSDMSLMIGVNGSAVKAVTVTGLGNSSTGTEIRTRLAAAINEAFPPVDVVSVVGSGGQFIIETTGTADSSTSLQLLDSPLVAALGLSSDDRTTVQGIDNVMPRSMAGSNSTVGEFMHLGEDTPPSATDFSSFYNSTLRKYRDISIVVLPGSHWDGGVGQANIAATLAHCDAMKNRVLIIDPPSGLELNDRNMVGNLGLPTSTYSTLYYPWVRMANPMYHPDKAPNRDKTVLVAPSAIAAGMWSKIDGKRGVWKAPAGVGTRLTGAAGLEFVVENLEQDHLNPLAVNCIRKFPNYGTVFWGSRTLATKADPEWRYVPVRRTAIYMEESIYSGIQWAVFEPNDHLLWSSLRANIGSFLNGMFRAGAFQGETAKDAYFVRCGLGDTMTQGDIDRGQVIVMVGFAPLKPAEFVIVRIQQKAGEV